MNNFWIGFFVGLSAGFLITIVVGVAFAILEDWRRIPTILPAEHPDGQEQEEAEN